MFTLARPTITLVFASGGLAVYSGFGCALRICHVFGDRIEECLDIVFVVHIQGRMLREVAGAEG